MSRISFSPRGMTARATRSPTWKMPYRSAAEPSPSARSRARGRMRRSSASFASAMFPSTKPVSVMRSQKRRRSPRKVKAKRPNAVPSARTVSGPFERTVLSRRKRGDNETDDHEITEGRVELRGLQVDHRDRALLAARAELGRADLPHEERQRQHREQRPRREQAREHRDRERQVRADDEGDVEPVRRVAAHRHRERARTRARILADIAPLVPMEDRG